MPEGVTCRILFFQDQNFFVEQTRNLVLWEDLNMPSDLLVRQFEHSRRLALLIMFALQRGYTVTGGDWYRDERCPYGSRKSKHHDRLATDLNLFRAGKYLTKTSDYQELGDFWESIGGKWGGRWQDGNHFES